VPEDHSPELLVTGAGGHVGSLLMRAAREVGSRALGTLRQGRLPEELGPSCGLDLADVEAIAPAVAGIAPRVIVHLGAISSPAAVHADPGRAARVNVDATRALARAATACGARLIFASTDLVFDGEAAPYDEDAPPRPQTVYGRLKLEAERIVLGESAGVVVRLPWMYGFPALARAPAFFATMVDSLRRGDPVRLFEDEYRSALWFEDAAQALLAIAGSDVVGVLHAGGPQRLSRLEVGVQTAQALGVSTSSIVAMRRADIPSSEPRMRDCSLTSARYRELFGAAPGRPLRAALAAMF
jgi:dTDP-4-dehydrorhamnose reductase